LSNSLNTINSASLSSTVFPSSSSAPNPNTKVFVGFSTYDTDTTGESTLYDIALVNRDLLNAFYTRVGERVMRPDWGCQIWEWLMDPLTPALHDQIVAEVVRICESDSRLNVLNTQVYQYQNGIRVEMTLSYQPYNVINSFTVTFENRQAAYFGDNNES
jgi:phage baseplate assembly protein W